MQDPANKQGCCCDFHPLQIVFSWYLRPQDPSSDKGTGFIADPIIDLSTQFTPPYRFAYP